MRRAAISAEQKLSPKPIFEQEEVQDVEMFLFSVM